MYSDKREAVSMSLATPALEALMRVAVIKAFKSFVLYWLLFALIGVNAVIGDFKVMLYF